MIAASLLWIPFTLLAAAGQTARNAMQRELTAKLGTVGATHVRFLFGFPFALVFLAGVFIATGLPMPALPWVFWPWVVVGAGAQILATALMLATMNDRSFVVTIAYIKTEAIQAAMFGLIFLGDPLTHRHGRRHPGRDGGRRHDVAQGQGRDGGRLPSGRARAVLRRDVRDFGGRLSRRDPLARAAELSCWPRRSR